jgi:membrane-associated protease RseP (regulator of RpoE activity)
VDAAFEHPPAAPRRTRAWIPVSLFLLTFLSAILANVVPTIPADDVVGVIDFFRAEPWRFLQGLPFAITLMGILLAHEMGHWLMARRHGVDQTLPYFIPAPTIFGTLGALILMRSQPPDRRVLLNVAAAGPFAGLVVAVPAMAWGLSRSTIASGPPELLFGSSLLVGWLSGLFGPGAGFAELSLHPVALAGWVGLFVTSLNLIPAAQLDGGTWPMRCSASARSGCPWSLWPASSVSACCSASRAETWHTARCGYSGPCSFSSSASAIRRCATSG